MIEADIRGRTGVAEDVLTSTCFGLLELLGGTHVVRFLETAKDINGNAFSMGSVTDVSVQYWLPLKEGTPDLLMTASRASGERLYVVVEAKHGAKQSGSEQLDRYYRSGQLLSPATPLVYLTHHRTMPRDEIEKLLSEVERNASVFWTNWYELYRYVTGCVSRSGATTGVEKNVLSTLAKYLDAKNYVCFTGWPECPDHLAVDQALTQYQVFYGDHDDESARLLDWPREEQYVRFYHDKEPCNAMSAEFIDYVTVRSPTS